MINECYRVFRNYCGYSLGQVSRVTGIPEDRILQIEQGLVIPNEDEERKIAALFNLRPECIRDNVYYLCDSVVHEPYDDSMYRALIDKSVIKFDVTHLTDDEKIIIATYRSLVNKRTAYTNFINMMESMDKI